MRSRKNLVRRTSALVVLLLSGACPICIHCFSPQCTSSWTAGPHHRAPSPLHQNRHPAGSPMLVLLDSSLGATSAQHASFNFGPVSRRDELLYTCERPGNTELGRINKKDNNNREDSSAEDSMRKEMLEWKAHVVDKQGITHVVILLDENELEDYAEPGLLESFYRQECNQQQVLVQPMRESGAAERIFEFIEQATAAAGSSASPPQAKIVAHCTGGVGRAGRVAAGWLVHRYDLTPEEATSETLGIAAELGINRKGNADMLREWLNAK